MAEPNFRFRFSGKNADCPFPRIVLERSKWSKTAKRTSQAVKGKISLSPVLWSVCQDAALMLSTPFRYAPGVPLASSVTAGDPWQVGHSWGKGKNNLEVVLLRDIWSGRP
jgi:hypothetical protein